MKINIKKLDDDAKLTKGSIYSAGFDLYSMVEENIEPGTNKLIKTGISMEIPENYFGAVYARSGLSVKEGLRPANCVGVIDSDYRGEIMVALYNDTNEVKVVKKGDRIAQIVVQPFIDFEINYVDELNDTDRSSGGFGSTGK